jgi:shikimate dehydrogenase
VSRPPAGAPWPTASTRPVVLLGWPARHSLSPEIHNAAFTEQGLDLVYLALEVPPVELHAVVAALGTMGVRGANVTVPHKQAVLECCDRLSDEARLIGAANTLTWTGDGLVGDNTDALGLEDALRADIGAVLQPTDRIVIFGAGGAARAAAVAIGRLGVGVTVAARRADAAAELAELAVRAGASTADAVDSTDEPALRAAATPARVVVNATPLGMRGESLPTPLMNLHVDQVAYDLVYDPAETPFLQAARQHGAGAHHGLGMLVGQAAASYRRWTAQEPPVATMSAVATVALGERARRTQD